MTLQQRIERVKREVQNGVVAPGELVSLLDDLSAVVRAHEDRLHAALGSLSYSETMMIRTLVDSLPSESGGLIVATQVADACNGARSAVVQALRKLEAAGLLMTRSLGQKGTMIRLVGITRSDLRRHLGGAA